jgi:signal transduction histidine kinase
MSHEIRTPLNAIYGISSLIANESFSRDEIKNYTNIIHENSQYLTRLIEDMIDISKLETDQFSLKFRPTLIEPIFSHLYENFREEIERKEKDIALEVSVPDRKRTIDTDPTRLEQVFNNLLNNAVKFTHEGRIHFGYYTNKDYLTFFVEDTGAGIKKENYEKIFERFIKIETSEEEVHRGTGIGLFLCKEIIHMMGGKIWLESEWGKGSTFYFTIPLSKNPVKNNASSSVTQNEYSYREK